MSDLRELYQEVILDHNRRPRNFRALEGANRHAEGYNPLCGDRLSLYLKVEDDVIKDASFQGSGCAISKASGSMMTDSVKGKTLSEVRDMFEQFRQMVTGNADHVVGVDDDFVNKAELVDVDGDLRVKDCREHLDDPRLHRESLEGVTTLEDRAGRRARIRRHSRRFFSARRVFVGELDDVVCHGRRSRYSASVDTTSSFASTAERSVCQARLAHFTRAG